MPVITQNYNSDDTFEPELLCPDNQWEEEAVEVLPRQCFLLDWTTYYLLIPTCYDAKSVQFKKITVAGSFKAKNLEGMLPPFRDAVANDAVVAPR